MGTIQGLDKTRLLALEAATVIDGEVNEDGDLILIQHDGTEINAGPVVGADGQTWTLAEPLYLDLTELNIRDATTSVRGSIELATDAETIAGTDAERGVTPAGLAAVTSTDTRRGLVELATDAETITGTDTGRAITPANLAALTSLDTRRGIVELATVTEVRTGTDTSRAVTPEGVRAVTVPIQGQVPSSVVVGSGSASVAADGTTFLTGASSFSLNGVFDGTGGDCYEIHSLLMDGTNVIDSSVNFRYRNAGTDRTTGYYHHITLVAGTGWGTLALSAPVQNNGSSHAVGFRAFTNFDITVKRPNTASLETEMNGFIASDGISQVSAFTWGRKTPDVNDGFTIFNSSGAAMTGWIKVVKVS